MVNVDRRRQATALVLSGVLLALPLGPLAQVASAQCADPRGNSYCTNGGQVTFSSPPSQPQPPAQNPNPPRNAPVTNPNPPRNAPVTNPNPPTNVNVTNPNPPTNVNVVNPNPPTNVDVQNPNAGDSGAQNPNAPISMAGGAQLTVAPASGAPGDLVANAGQGLGANNNIYLNVTDAAGNILDTDSRAFSCVETDDVLLNLYQDRGWGCSGGAQPGPINRSGADGTLVGAIRIPSTAVPGPARVCAMSVIAPPCTTITIVAPGS